MCALILLGLVEGLGHYQQINEKFLTGEELETVLAGCFVGAALYVVCIIGCLASFCYQRSKNQGAD
jgi:phage shock protein PspC (stress-responsive transcriptional regulator)